MKRQALPATASQQPQQVESLQTFFARQVGYSQPGLGQGGVNHSSQASSTISLN